MGVTTWTEQQDTILIDGLKSDQTYMQIADKLGISKAMVSGRIHRLRKLRPSDLPAKNMFTPTSKLTDPNAKGELAPNQLNLKKLRSQSGVSGQAKVGKPHGSRLNWKLPSIAVEKPTNLPVAFMELPRGACSWCLDDINQDVSATMMCCAAPVMDKSKREGDRRSSHCAYHYQMSVRRLS